jgi:thiamine-phosphate pyrophosphorylase
LARETKSLSTKLLSQRNSEHDIGHPHFSRQKQLTVGRDTPTGLADLGVANARRVEEALRVIEEVAKLPEISSVLNAAGFERVRFELYALEQDLVSRISRREKTERIGGLYVIVDREFLGGRDDLDTVSQVIEGGARVIQLRDKRSEKGELLLAAQRLKDFCDRAGVLFIVNDHLDIAIAVEADGLHVGQGDLPLPVARRELPIGSIIGCSVTTLSQATQAQKEGADYIAVGSMFPTTTKKGATVVGVDMLEKVKRIVSTPLVAIGGINQSNICEVVAAGADAVAVISDVLGREDPRLAVQELISRMDVVKGEC